MRLRRRLRQVRDRYRHSLQLRVITATLILSAVVVSVLGYILMQHLVAGIYANMQQTAKIISDEGLATAGNATDFSEPANPTSRQAMWHLDPEPRLDRRDAVRGRGDAAAAVPGTARLQRRRIRSVSTGRGRSSRRS